MDQAVRSFPSFPRCFELLSSGYAEILAPALVLPSTGTRFVSVVRSMIPLSKTLIPFLAVLLFGRDLAGTPIAAREVEEAETAFSIGQYEYAYARWQRVLKRDPFNEEAREGLQTLGRVAEQLLEEALKLQARDPARARENLRTATLISDPDSEINRLARNLLGGDF